MPLAHDDESKGILMEMLAEAKGYVLGQENGSKFVQSWKQALSKVYNVGFLWAGGVDNLCGCYYEQQ